MDESIIIKYLRKTLSQEERKEFVRWLNEDPAHLKLFKEVKKSWALTTSFDAGNYTDSDSEFNRFKYRYLHPGKTRNGISPLLIQISQIAAIVVVTAALSIYIQHLISKNGNSLQTSFNEITTNAGEKTRITLADGSQIWINSCTKLKYPTSLTGSKVDLFLDGEAYFDLKKIPNRKIIVHTSRLNINVIGTAFNLRSYSDDNIIETTLVRGKISITHTSEQNNASKEVVLKPNQSAIYFKNSNTLKVPVLAEHRIQNSETQEGLEQLAIKNQSNVIVEESINTEPQISWIEGKFVFRKETFENLAKRLERHYNVKITITDSKLKKSKFSGTFDKESIEQALKALSYPVPFNYTIIKDSITIQPK